MKKTKNIGLICEFNPIHNGHKYLIDTIKKLNDPCRVICVMSGNFTQRGEPAITDKYTRAKWAITCGADAVFELILPFSLMSAEGFAYGATSILDSLGNIDELWFGSESGNVSELTKAAQILESENFAREFKANSSMNNEYNYATLINNTLNEAFNFKMNGANDLLGIEYIRSIKRLKSGIIPNTIKRVGVSHDAQTTSEFFASASNLRQMILNGEHKKLGLYTVDPVSKHFIKNQAVRIENNERGIIQKLREKIGEDNSIYINCNELGNKICRESEKAKNLQELYFNVKTKNFTLARIRRAVLSIYLEIKKESSLNRPDHTKLLAINKNGMEYISENKKIRTIDIVIKAAKEKNNQGEMYKLNRNADRLYTLFYKDIQNRDLFLSVSPYVKPE